MLEVSDKCQVEDVLGGRINPCLMNYDSGFWSRFQCTKAIYASKSSGWCVDEYPYSCPLGEKALLAASDLFPYKNDLVDECQLHDGESREQCLSNPRCVWCKSGNVSLCTDFKLTKRKSCYEWQAAVGGVCEASSCGRDIPVGSKAVWKEKGEYASKLFTNSTAKKENAPLDAFSLLLSMSLTCSEPHENFTMCACAQQKSCASPDKSCGDCFPGCACKPGYLRLADSIYSPCVKVDSCPGESSGDGPKEIQCSGFNEEIVECGPCGEEESCTKQTIAPCETCSPGCRCKEGFVRRSADPLSPCIPVQTCATGYSQLSCKELELDSTIWGSPLVCAASMVVNWTDSQYGENCPGLLDFDTAYSVCSTIGMRLCSASEILNDEARKTGCGADSLRVWTSSEAGCRPSEAQSVAGSTEWLHRSPMQCKYKGVRLGVRCCADEYVPGREIMIADEPFECPFLTSCRECTSYAQCKWSQSHLTCASKCYSDDCPLTVAQCPDEQAIDDPCSSNPCPGDMLCTSGPSDCLVGFPCPQYTCKPHDACSPNPCPPSLPVCVINSDLCISSTICPQYECQAISPTICVPNPCPAGKPVCVPQFKECPPGESCPQYECIAESSLIGTSSTIVISASVLRLVKVGLLLFSTACTSS